jgi:hypothetical protein
MSEMPAKYDAEPAVIEQLIRGDVSNVPREALLRYVFTFCERVGISPLAVPFSLMKTQQGMQLVANRNFYDAVANKYSVSRECVGEGFFEGTKLYYTRYRATTPDGRVTEDMALVDTAGLNGKDLANAIMKAHTKGRNRVTRAHLGFPFPDETEAETVPGASVVSIEEVPSGSNGEPLQDDALPKPEPPRASREQIKRIHALAKRLGMNEEAYRRLLSERFGCQSSKSLTPEQAEELAREMAQLWREREQAQQQAEQSEAETLEVAAEQSEHPGSNPHADSGELVSPVDANEHLQQLGMSREDVRAWRKAWVATWGDGMAFNRIAVSATSREDFIRAMQQSGVRVSTAVGGA